MFEISAEHFEEITKDSLLTAGKTQCRYTVDKKEKVIHITGQSSRNNDWGDNFDFRAREVAVQWFADKKDIKIHAGFLRQYKAVRDILMTVCEAYSDYAIRVDGYSLGASWTQIFTQDVLYHWPNRDVQAILYAPGNPWRKLPKVFKAKLKQHITYVRSIWDPVTWMRMFGFCRYGAEVRIGKWYRILPLQHKTDQIIKGLKELRGDK